MLGYILGRPFTPEEEEDARSTLETYEAFLVDIQAMKARHDDHTVRQLEQAAKWDLAFLRSMIARRSRKKFKSE